MRRRIDRPLILLILGLAIRPVAYSQIGKVESDGQPIPGATIRAAKGDLVLTTLSDDTGQFVLPGVAPGTWEMSATMFGFEAVHREVQILGADTRVDFTLRMKVPGPKPARSVVPLNAGAANKPSKGADPVPKIPSSEFHKTSQQAVNDSGDSYWVVGSLSSQLTTKAGEFDTQHGSRGGYTQRSEAAETIGNHKVETQDLIHWSLSYDPGIFAFDAAPFSLNGQRNPKPSVKQNFVGVSVGGPLKLPRLRRPEKTLVFVNYTANLQEIASSPTSTVPTISERKGEFSGAGYTVYDPTDRHPFPLNRIPLSRISLIALGLLQYIPAPNQPGALQNYHLSTATPSDTQLLDARVVTTLSRTDRLKAGVNWQTSGARIVQAYGFRDQASANGLAATVVWGHTFEKQALNDLTLSFNRNRASATPYFAYGVDVAAQLGIAGPSRTPTNFGPPNLNFTNFSPLTDGFPSRDAITNMVANDQVSLSTGKHNWSVGAGYTKSFDNAVTDANGRGTFVFTGLATSALDANGQPLAGTGYDLADFLVGLPQASSTSFGKSSTYFRSSSYFSFVQDNYCVLPNLTLNLGLRYEYFSPWQEKFGRMSNLLMASNFSSVTMVTPAMPGEPAGLIQPDRNNFAPRIAFAWKPSGRSTIALRAGYAWFYDPGVYNRFKALLAAQPPFGVASAMTTSADHVLTLSTGLAGMPAETNVTNTFAVKQNYRDMYAQTWNVTVQADLAGGLVSELAYIGTKGTRLDVLGVPNQAPPGSPLTAPNRLRIGNAAAFIYDTPDGNSIYHMGEARLTRRFHRGLASSIAYTYSKSIDNSSTLAGSSNAVAQNFYNFGAERGVSSFSRRHSMNADFVWASPFGGDCAQVASPRWVSTALGDWRVSGSILLASGTPLTAQVLGNQADSAGTGTIGSSRASATGVPVNTGFGLFNLLAFTVPPPGQYGNAGRNTIPGPGLFTASLSLQRMVRLGRRGQLQLRLDSTNVTNRVNIVSVGTVVNALSYGVPSAAGSMRTVTAHAGFNF